VRYVLVAALNRTADSGGAWPRFPALLSCACREQTAGVDHRPIGRVGPGSAPGPAMRPMPGVQPRLIMGACSSSDWTVPSV
jgi:hypothetical protein